MDLSDYDLGRLAALQRARRRATGLLAVVAVLFVLTFFMGDAPWMGFLRTTMEASMIGGLADWFAVTALFRHPLGLPIPHTAIIPRSKEGLAASLGEFVRHNFLAPDQLVERIENSRLPARVGTWLRTPENAELLAGHIASAAAGLVAEREGSGEHRAPLPVPAGKLLGRGAEAALVRGLHERPVSRAVSGLADLLDDHQDVLRRRIRKESPWWVPEPLDEAVFQRALEALRRFLLEVASDPRHELRRALTARLTDVALRLQTDDEWSRQIDQEIADLIRSGAGDLQADLAQNFREAAEHPDSRLRLRLAGLLQRLGDRLVTDPGLAAAVEGWLTSMAGPLSRVGQKELTELITATVERWDAEDTSRRLELWMGRDLQFVRINGTVVGGLAGLAIHTLVYFIAG